MNCSGFVLLNVIDKFTSASVEWTHAAECKEEMNNGTSFEKY